MIEVLYKKMEIPESCRLGKRIYKKLFHENAKLSAADTKAMRDDVDSIFWVYSFKPSTIPIQSYKDMQREYLEVALLQVKLKHNNRMSRLAEIVHRAIPYPLIVVFTSGNTCSISLAYKRFSQAEKEAIVADDFQSTDWLDLNNLTDNQDAFIDSMDISKWPHTNFFAFYRAAMERVIALSCTKHGGLYSFESVHGLSANDRVNMLTQVEKLLNEKAEIQGKLKKEKNLGNQVLLNTRIKEIKNRIEVIKSEL